MNYRDRRCPHCGRTNGLYTKSRYENVVDNYDYDGNHEGEHFDNALRSGGKTFYCKVCDKIVCRSVKQYDKLYGSKAE